MTFNEEMNKNMREAIAHPEAYKVGVKDGYADTIDKACEWLKDHAKVFGYADVTDTWEADYKYDSEMLIEHFRKAMEE